jgi:signal transduction histidine kinase
MRKVILACAVAAVALSIGASRVLAAGEFGTSGEAKLMLERAITALKANPTDAIAKFNDPKGGFRDRDLYVFCFESTTGKFTAHVNQSLLGTDTRALKEKDGSPLGQKVFDAAQKEGTVSTVSYNFPKPGTTDPVPKESYVTKVGNQSCGVGYYK